MLDIIIISDGKTKELVHVTQVAVGTCIETSFYKPRIIVIESQDVEYQGAETILLKQGKFSYNRALNFGAMVGNSKYIAFCNNDIVFTENWDKYLIYDMDRHKAVSGSPICPKTSGQYNVHPHSGVRKGWAVRRLFCGWCFVLKRSVFEMYPLNEDVGFWLSDNITADILKKKGYRHVLSTRSIVHHKESKTLYSLPKKEQDRITWQEIIDCEVDYSGREQHIKWAKGNLKQ